MCGAFCLDNKGNYMKLKQKIKLKTQATIKWMDDDEDAKIWVRENKITTKQMRVDRYIRNDFYFNKEKDK